MFPKSQVQRFEPEVLFSIEGVVIGIEIDYYPLLIILGDLLQAGDISQGQMAHHGRPGSGSIHGFHGDQWHTQYIRYNSCPNRDATDPTGEENRFSTIP
jgi:hypothetical protein